MTVNGRRKWSMAGAFVLAIGLVAASAGIGVVGGSAAVALAQVATLGSPAPDAEASAAPVEELSAEDSMLAYAACMRENGVETEDPQFDVNGDLISKPAFKAALDKDQGDETFQAASDVCRELLMALKPALDPALQAEQTESALRFAACMREQGLDWPDPAPDGSKFAGSDFKVDKTSPEFAAAFEACGDELALDRDEGD